MKKIGEESAEQLEYVPASYRVKKTIRPKYACDQCKEGVAVALAPVDAIARCKAAPGMLAHIAVSKFADHLPLYRQCEMLQREGVTLSNRTLGGWIRQVADVISPIAQAQWRSIVDSHVVGADETTVRYLTPHMRGSKTGYLWAYLGDQNEVYFDFTAGRGGAEPMRVLRDYGGRYLQADGYTVYDSVVQTKPGVDIVGCWAHVRRKFIEARSSDPTAAMLMLAMISTLYRVEREVKDADISCEKQRQKMLLAARHEKSLPILGEIKDQLDALHGNVLPKSPIGKAVGYPIRRWRQLLRYTDDGAIPIDNNAVERQMRAVAIGRKNWMFCGSPQAGNAAGVMYGLLNTCKLQGVNSEAWLRDVLIRIRDHPKDRMAELTPRIWKLEQRSS
jgi:transposase